MVVTAVAKYYIVFCWVFLTTQQMTSYVVAYRKLFTEIPNCSLGNLLRNYDGVRTQSRLFLRYQDEVTLTCNSSPRAPSPPSYFIVISDIFQLVSRDKQKSCKQSAFDHVGSYLNQCNGRRNCTLERIGCDGTIPEEYCRITWEINYFCVSADKYAIHLPTQSPTVIQRDVLFVTYTTPHTSSLDVNGRTVCALKKEVGENKSFDLYVLKVNQRPQGNWSAVVEFSEHDSSFAENGDPLRFELKFLRVVHVPNYADNVAISFEGFGNTALLLKGPGIKGAEISCKETKPGLTTAIMQSTMAALGGSESTSDIKLAVGLGVGITLAVLLMAAAAVFLIFFIRKRKLSRRNEIYSVPIPEETINDSTNPNNLQREHVTVSRAVSNSTYHAYQDVHYADIQEISDALPGAVGYTEVDEGDSGKGSIEKGKLDVGQEPIYEDYDTGDEYAEYDDSELAKQQSKETEHTEYQ